MDDLIWQQWVKSWHRVVESMGQRGYESGEVTIAPPALPQEIATLESTLGSALPVEFAYIVTHYSAKVSLYWHLGRSINEEEWQRREFPAPYDPVFSSWAEALWDIKCLFDPLEEYIDSDDPIWKNKLAFLPVMNGDCIAFDMSQGMENCPIVYLSHENGSNHGRRLADNFVEFITRWSNIGCPGPEDWQMEPFLEGTQGGLLASGEVVEQWKHLLNTSPLKEV